MKLKPNTQVCAAFLLLLCIHLWLLLDINTEAALWSVYISSNNNNDNFSFVNINTSYSSNSSINLFSSTTSSSIAFTNSVTADYSSEVSRDASDGTEVEEESVTPDSTRLR